jgi:hypothetical protein
VSDIVYRTERDAGIEAAIRKSRSVACVSQARLVPRGYLPAHMSAHVRATAGLEDVDLRFIECVLTTAGENRNQDAFLPVELWSARTSPTHKPVNLLHDDGAVIGHMTQARATDGELNDVPDETGVDDLPWDLQLVVGCALYAKWATPSRQERMNQLLEEVDAGKWACSMEVLFVNHDYLLTAPNGSTEVVTRTEATAHMSKSLSCYGGPGTYAGKAIGRVLRGCTFSGIALVQNPACDGAVILKPPVEQAVADWFNGRHVASAAAIPKPATKVAAEIFEFLTT